MCCIPAKASKPSTVAIVDKQPQSQLKFNAHPESHVWLATPKQSSWEEADDDDEDDDDDEKKEDHDEPSRAASQKTKDSQDSHDSNEDKFVKLMKTSVKSVMTLEQILSYSPMTEGDVSICDALWNRVLIGTFLSTNP